MKQVPVTMLTVLLACQCCGCHTWRSSQRSRSREDRQQQYTHTDSAGFTLQLSQLRLSADTTLTITELVPEGAFHYHPVAGYTGQARSVRIRQARMHHERQQDSTTVRQTDRSQTSAVQTESTRNRNKVAAPVAPRFRRTLLLIAGVLALAIVAWLRYRYRTNSS